MHTFQHIEGDFPNIDTLNVNKYVNTFDYSKYDTTQMTIGVCTVPWDVGLIHVGNAQIGGLGNVVYFETKEKRDAYFESLEDAIIQPTKFREYHDALWFKIDIPYQKIMQYNYCWFEYTKLPVDYAEGGKDKFFFFIREAQYLSPSSTKVKLIRDTFQTFIYDCNISYLMLERGHAPLALTSVEDYLSNPQENNAYLLADDVNFGSSYQRKYNSSIILNDSDMWSVVVAMGNPRGSWGSKAGGNWKTLNGNATQDGQPSLYAFALEPSELTTFLSNVDASVPQFKQTIQGVFFIAKKLVSTRGNSFMFCDVECRLLSQKTSNIRLADLTKEAFGYGEHYRDIAKLYTYPYAYLEIADNNGNVTQLKIEETSGDLSLTVTSSLAYPWLNLDGRLSGIGSGGSTVSFSNVSSHSFSFSGGWYDYLYNWSIPVFAVTQEASVINDYATHFDRAQRALENATTQTNALNSNAATNTNDIASNDMQHTNTLANNTTNRLNTATHRALATSLLGLTNGLIEDTKEANVDKVSDDWDADYIFNVATTWVSNDVAAISTAINGAQNVINGALAGAATGAVGGAIGIASSAAAGAVGSTASSIVAAASVPLTITNNDNVSELTRNLGDSKTDNAIANMRAISDLQQSFNSSKNDQENTREIEIADRIKTTGDDNANRTQTISNANANRTKATNDGIANLNKSTADTAITNSIAQAALGAPSFFGTFQDGESSTTRPMGLFCNIVTQSKDAIEQAGDYFLRFGYAVNRSWSFETFNLMPRFTYWKASDMWISSNTVPDAYLDEIRFYLLGGVCVWRKPEDIGNISIYENR